MLLRSDLRRNENGLDFLRRSADDEDARSLNLPRNQIKTDYSGLLARAEAHAMVHGARTMPFVISFPNGFLNRDGSHNRRLVKNVNDATVWNKIGHAKNAARAAVNSKQIRLACGEKVWILPVQIKLDYSDCASDITFNPRSKVK
jgi:hypothetical protein